MGASTVDPSEASGVNLLVWRDDLAGAIVEAESSVALLANANVLVEELTLRGDLAADAIGVEVVVL